MNPQEFGSYQVLAHTTFYCRRNETILPSPRCDRRYAAALPRQLLIRGFLLNNRDDLIQRYKDKVAFCPARGTTPDQLSDGIPMFLNQLTRTLGAEDEGDAAGGLQISGPLGGDASALSEMGVPQPFMAANCSGSATR